MMKKKKNKIINPKRELNKIMNSAVVDPYIGDNFINVDN